MDVIDLKEKFKFITDYWSPKIIGELNGQLVKIAKVKGDFVWHHHKEEDELFFVVKGTLFIKMRTNTIKVKEGEMFIVPRDTEHKPYAEEECWIMLFEPKETKHTGDIEDELTKDQQEWI